MASKPDSQEICFVPDGDYASVVEQIRPEARERDRGGAGLGLAVVDSVVQAGGGDVTSGDPNGSVSPGGNAAVSRIFSADALPGLVI